MTTLASGHIAPRTANRVAPSGPSFLDRLLSQVTGFYAAFMDAQSLAFKRASEKSRALWSQGE